MSCILAPPPPMFIETEPPAASETVPVAAAVVPEELKIQEWTLSGRPAPPVRTGPLLSDIYDYAPC